MRFCDDKTISNSRRHSLTASWWTLWTPNKTQSRSSFALCRRAHLCCPADPPESGRHEERACQGWERSYQFYAFSCLVCPIPSRGILYVCFILSSASLKVLFLHKFEFPALKCMSEGINEIWFIFLFIICDARCSNARRHQQSTACASSLLFDVPMNFDLRHRGEHELCRCAPVECFKFMFGPNGFNDKTNRWNANSDTRCVSLAFD